MGSWVSCWLSAIIVTKQPNLKFRRIEGAVTETHRLPAQLGSKEDESLAVGEGHGGQQLNMDGLRSLVHQYQQEIFSSYYSDK